MYSKKILKNLNPKSFLRSNNLPNKNRNNFMLFTNSLINSRETLINSTFNYSSRVSINSTLTKEKFNTKAKIPLMFKNDISTKLNSNEYSANYTSSKNFSQSNSSQITKNKLLTLYPDYFNPRSDDNSSNTEQKTKLRDTKGKVNASKATTSKNNINLANSNQVFTKISDLIPRLFNYSVYIVQRFFHNIISFLSFIKSNFMKMLKSSIKELLLITKILRKDFFGNCSLMLSSMKKNESVLIVTSAKSISHIMSIPICSLLLYLGLVTPGHLTAFYLKFLFCNCCIMAGIKIASHEEKLNNDNNFKAPLKFSDFSFPIFGFGFSFACLFLTGVIPSKFTIFLFTSALACCFLSMNYDVKKQYYFDRIKIEKRLENILKLIKNTQNQNKKNIKANNRLQSKIKASQPELDHLNTLVFSNSFESFACLLWLLIIFAFSIYYYDSLDTYLSKTKHLQKVTIALQKDENYLKNNADRITEKLEKQMLEKYS